MASTITPIYMRISYRVQILDLDAEIPVIDQFEASTLAEVERVITTTDVLEPPVGQCKWCNSYIWQDQFCGDECAHSWYADQQENIGTGN